jgi:SAM-dependent methyltransferase
MANPLEDLQRVIDTHTANKACRVLEAGCGSMSKIRLGDDVSVVGIDISSKQLDRNTGLTERILADIQTYPLPSDSFDLIVCWDVLEHLDTPEKALANFFTSAKPDGLIVLAFPNLYSLKGVITKMTPHSVHIWYYRNLLHLPNAGLDDTAPFVTPFKKAMTYPAIRKLAREHGVSEAFFALRESHDMQYVRRNYWLFNAMMTGVAAASKAATLGRLDATHSDCIMVLRKDRTSQ